MRHLTQKNFLTAIALASLIAMPGCVMKSTHEALQNEYAETKQMLEDKNQNLNAAIEKLEKEKADLEKELSDLKSAREALEGRVQLLSSDKAHLESDKATLEQDRAQLLTNAEKLEASMDELKAALAELTRRKAEADARIAEFKALIARFQSLIDAGKLKVKIEDGRMVVVLASDVLFPPGSAKLSKKGQEAIAEVAVLLSEIEGRKFQIEGHTDNVAIHSAVFPSNWELASARALTVLKLMVKNGMAPERISAASFGDSKPAGDNATNEGKAANRRIEIVVTPDLSALPGFEELNRVSQDQESHAQEANGGQGAAKAEPPKAEAEVQAQDGKDQGAKEVPAP